MCILVKFRYDNLSMILGVEGTIGEGAIGVDIGKKNYTTLYTNKEKLVKVREGRRASGHNSALW